MEYEAHDKLEKLTKSQSSNTSAVVTSPITSDGFEEIKKYPVGLKFWLAFFSLCVVITLGGLDFSIVGVAVPSLSQEFNDISHIAWYNVAYRLTACACQFTWGKVYHQFSLRRSYLASAAVFLVGSAVSASAKSSVAFIIGRAISGMGSAGMLTGIFTALVEITPLNKRPIFLSLLSGLEAAAMVVAPILGGAITEHVSWRWCFYINLPIGVVAMIGLNFFIPDTSPPGHGQLSWKQWKQWIYRMDILGTGVLIACLTCLFMILSWAGFKYPWSDYRIIILIVFFVCTLVGFCYNQAHMGAHASLSAKLLKQRSVLGASMFTFLVNGAVFVVQYYLPIYFQVVRGYEPAVSGYFMLPIMVGFNAALILQGFVTSAVGYYVPFMILSSVLLSIGCGLITTWSIHTNVALLLIYQGIFGIGGGLAFEIPQIAAQTVLSEQDATLGVSITLFAQNFGGALFISIAQQIFGMQLLGKLGGKVPGLTSQDIQNLGLIDVRGLDTGSNGVLEAIQYVFRQTWILALVLSATTIMACALMEWRSVKEDKKQST